MKRSVFVLTSVVLIFCSCNNSGNGSSSMTDSTKKTNTNSEQSTINTPAPPDVSGPSCKIFVEGKESDLHASALVTKDNYKLSPGNDYLVMLTCPGADGHETFHINFVMALKPGVYPVVGTSYMRGQNPNNQMYGGLLGGQPKLTGHKVNITECKDLGSNNAGGHRWSISGDFSEITIAATPVMLLDKTKNHPAEIKIEKGSFANVTFDDNWEDTMKKASDMMKKK